MNEYVIAVKKLEYELLLKSKAKVQRQQMNYAEGNVFTGIKDVWVAKQVRCNQQLEVESAELKQREDLRKFGKSEIEEVEFGSFEDDNIKSAIDQWRRQYSVSISF